MALSISKTFANGRYATYVGGLSVILNTTLFATHTATSSTVHTQAGATATISLAVTGPTPGSGWGGPTSQPSNQGAGRASTRSAIGGIGEVQYQTFTSNFDIFVYCDHPSGIKNVTLAIDGGAFVEGVYTADPRLLNSHFGYLYGWKFSLNISDFPDGFYEARAIIRPNAGEALVCQGSSLVPGSSLYFSCNAGGTLAHGTYYADSVNGNDSNDGLTAGTAKATTQNCIYTYGLAHGGTTSGFVDGLTVNLLAGTYDIPSFYYLDESFITKTDTSTRFITFQAAPGVSRNDVIITGSAANPQGQVKGLKTKLQAYRNVTMTGRPLCSDVLKAAYDDGDLTSVTAVWFDNVRMLGPGRTAGASFTDFSMTHGWFTADSGGGSECYDMQDAIDGMCIQRNTYLHKLGQSGLHNCLMALTVYIDDIDDTGVTVGGGPAHPDIDQMSSSGNWNNIFHMGVVTLNPITETGIRIQESGTNIAYVQCHIDTTGAIHMFERERAYTNLMFRSCDLLGGTIASGVDYVPLDNWWIGCTFNNGADPSSQGLADGDVNSEVHVVSQ